MPPLTAGIRLTETESPSFVGLLSRLAQDPVEPDYLLARLAERWKKEGGGPSQALDFIRESNRANPVIFLDEVDKAAGTGGARIPCWLSRR